MFVQQLPFQLSETAIFLKIVNTAELEVIHQSVTYILSNFKCMKQPVGPEMMNNKGGVVHTHINIKFSTVLCATLRGHIVWYSGDCTIR